LTTLEERSHCPRRRRQPTWSFPLAEKVLTLRLQFPRWGKDKLAVLLRRQHLPVSTSMVGRILTIDNSNSLIHNPYPSVDYPLLGVVSFPVYCDFPIR
jgi:putative transposase